jgi:hypothetical protein
LTPAGAPYKETAHASPPLLLPEETSRFTNSRSLPSL